MQRHCSQQGWLSLLPPNKTVIFLIFCSCKMLLFYKYLRTIEFKVKRWGLQLSYRKFIVYFGACVYVCICVCMYLIVQLCDLLTFVLVYLILQGCNHLHRRNVWKTWSHGWPIVWGDCEFARKSLEKCWGMA